MGLIDELNPGPGKSPAHDALVDGTDMLDLNQEVKFRAYTRTVLPLDGYIFWQPLEEVCFQGSLHYTQDMEQNDDETFGSAVVRFTTAERVVEFTESPPNTIWVGRGRDFRFAFFQQEGFYDAARLYHYFGRSIPPAMETQLLDVPGSIDPTQAVTSNSLALWIQANTYTFAPIYAGLPGGLVLYPAGLVPPNLVPPYGAVKIFDTRALQAVPSYRGGTVGTDQLNSDRALITLYGLQHNAGIDFLNAILMYSSLTDNIGLMNCPTVVDGNRRDASMQVVGMQKFVEFEVSYRQSRVNTIARQLIESVAVNYSFSGGVSS